MSTQDFFHPSHYWGCVASKSNESPLKGDTPLLINQGFISFRFVGVALQVTSQAALKEIGGFGLVALDLVVSFR